MASERRGELRALAVADIFDAVFGIWWRESWTLFAIVLVATLPFQAVANVSQIVLVPDWYASGSPFDFDPAEGAEVAPSEVWRAVVAAALAAILGLVSYALAQAACFKAVADSYLGGRPTWRGSLAFSLRRAPSVLWVAVLESVLLLLAFVLLVLPAIWLAFAWSVALPALLAEDVRGRRALGRSFRLVRGTWWRTAGVVVLAFLIAGFAALVVTLPFDAIATAAAPDNALVAVVAGTLAGTVGAVASTPLFTAFVTLLYFDLRARKDGPEIVLAAD